MPPLDDGLSQWNDLTTYDDVSDSQSSSVMIVDEDKSSPVNESTKKRKQRDTDQVDKQRTKEGAKKRRKEHKTMFQSELRNMQNCKFYYSLFISVSDCTLCSHVFSLRLM